MEADGRSCSARDVATAEMGWWRITRRIADLEREDEPRGLTRSRPDPGVADRMKLVCREFGTKASIDS